MSNSITLKLPEAIREWIEEQVAGGSYKSASELVRQLVEEEKRRRLRNQIDANLHEAIDSGRSTTMTKVDWDQIRKEGRKRLASRGRTR
jgi:antitoxin ParD1/3/4